MDVQGEFLATLLDASGGAFAAGAVARLQEVHPELVGRWGFRDLRDDLEIRLQHMGQALAAGRSELFRFDVAWVASTHRSRGVEPKLLDRMLIALRDELASGLPAPVAPQALALLDDARASLVEPPPATGDDPLQPAPHAELARSFLEAVLAGRRSDAEQLVLDAYDGGLSLDEIHVHVLQAVQIEMGRLWESGATHVADEHLGSRTVEEVLAVLRHRAPRQPACGKRVLVACVRGNHHGIGARIVADQFEQKGWTCFAMGADLPAEDLVAAAAQYEVDLVALSSGLGLHVRATAEAVAALRQHLPDVRILVGGQPFALVPDLWEVVGADGTAVDAIQATREGARLVGSA